jgi:hypothetical protein
MPRRATLAILICLLGACRTTAEPPAIAGGAFAVPGETSERHRLRYADGQVSRNDSCMILLGNRLNRRVPPLYVNGEPLGFC